MLPSGIFFVSINFWHYFCRNLFIYCILYIITLVTFTIKPFTIKKKLLKYCNGSIAEISTWWKQTNKNKNVNEIVCPEAEEHILICDIKLGVQLPPLRAQHRPNNNTHGPPTLFLSFKIIYILASFVYIF